MVEIVWSSATDFGTSKKVGENMVPFKLSIRARLMLFIAALMAAIFVLAAIAVASLMTVDRTTMTMDRKWLMGTQILGALSERVAGFRIAETYMGQASDSGSLGAADLLATEQRNAITNLQREYTALGNSTSVAASDSLRAALREYFAAHDAWLKSDIDSSRDVRARRDSALHQLYGVVEAATAQLISTNRAEAQAEVSATGRLVDRTIAIVLAVCCAAILFGVWLLILVHKNITQPIGAITDALSKLAAGNRALEVPEMNRNDEIGEMAKALDGFRANAEMLEQAHEETRIAREQAQTLARHDALTGLPNRRVLAAELLSVINHAKNDPATYMVLIVDLDRFKPVNDLQGYPVGDVVLCEVARRLRQTVRREDIVARLGGDEFAIIARSDQPAYSEGAMLLATRVLGAIREPIIVGEGRVEVDASIGIASCPADGLDPESLLHAADIAMCRAKRDGRGTFRFFAPSMVEELRAQAALEEELKTAIATGAITPNYQPLVDLRDRNVYGFEILSRWNHPERGAIPPDVFIPLAEQLGLIPALTSSVLRQACRDSADWGENIHLALNISPVQLKDSLLPTKILAILKEESFSASRLEVEMTETALVSDIKTAKNILASFQSLGIKIALDDFGTGYSSLYHLRELNFDKVKIDRSFVQSMEHNSESEKIVDAILSLARSLGLPTVAEGIETPVVLRHLADKGCEYGQGYYFGKAMTAEKAKGMLDQEAATTARDHAEFSLTPG
jgi:diguanylate cyclase (GGDEF)-like protein